MWNKYNIGRFLVGGWLWDRFIKDDPSTPVDESGKSGIAKIGLLLPAVVLSVGYYLYKKSK